MSEDIDFAGVIETLQHENERLRLLILKMRTASHPLDGLSVENARMFLVKNYIFIVAIGFMLIVAFCMIDTIKGLFDRSKE